MTRRLLALLAVPALAMGFALASPRTEDADAAVPFIYISHCSLYNWKIGESVMQGDEKTAREWHDQAEQAGC